MSKRIWITWETQRRNQSLSRELGAELYQYDFKSSRLSRYANSVFYTLVTFVRERPALIIVQNPSIVLALLSVNYGMLRNIPVVVDAHNAGVFPFDGKKWWANKITQYLFRNAAITIVSNMALSDYVEDKGGKTAILPDPLPNFELDNLPLTLCGKKNVMFICTFASDEPFMEVIEAGRLLNRDTCIYITGQYKGDINTLKNNLPENVILTGYVSEDKFLRILHSVDVVIDLTTREDCLVCGAYEAISAEKVLIVSATKVLREYFNKGTLYTKNNSIDIAKNINIAIRDGELLAIEVKELKKEKLIEWSAQKAELEMKLMNLIA